MNYEELEAKYAGSSISDLGTALRDLKSAYKAASDAKTALGAEIDFLAKNKMVEVMDEMGVSSLNLKGIGRLSIRGDAYCSVVGGMKEDLFQWMRDNGFDSLISETVNSSTLKAFIKEQTIEGNDVPDETIVKFTPYSMVSLTKA